MSDLERYRTDHLILLVGGNPLPNYVAARVLGKKGGTLHLVHSQKSYKIAQRLDKCFRAPAEGNHLAGGFGSIEFIQVGEDEPSDIYNKVHELAQRLGSSVGLNYTSGNRPMSVHAYEAVKDACAKAQFSYLDAGRLEMLVFDARRVSHRFRADPLLSMRLETLLQLQGLEASSIAPSDTPVQPGLAASLAELHSTPEGEKAWFEWRRTGSDGWKKLPKGQPRLKGVEAALEQLCGGDPTPDCVAQALGYTDLSSSTEWWKSKWLEHYVFAELQEAIKGREDTHDAWMGVKRKRQDFENRDFELDVVVMRRYQLFVFSCIVSHQAQACKDHLMEAYVRARQAGGDEARVGLVCTSDQPEALQREIVGDLDAGGKIRVFGRGDLLSLADRIRDWLDQQP
ncbi:MAG: hypothetical protein KatS3mg053_1473 [Candidatus Roseilinea sp.]|nr:MAG: hypothetical protein KatS3mg053_1473 [Candidatus Roseilinea sp.]